MTRRVCVESGCPVISDSTRCPDHTKAKDKQRGTTTARGYGPEHRATRATWQRRMDAGERIPCARCGQPITGAWHLDHSDDRASYIGPSHDTCNLSAAGKARHQ